MKPGIGKRGEKGFNVHIKKDDRLVVIEFFRHAEIARSYAGLVRRATDIKVINDRVMMTLG
jgi:hypothetical protein